MARKDVVTREIYEKMKAELHSAADDQKVMQKYGYSATVVRKTRNTSDYDEYCARTFRYHGNPRRNGGVTAPQQRVTAYKPMAHPVYLENEWVNREARKENLLAILLIVVLVVLVAYIAILPWLVGAW